MFCKHHRTQDAVQILPVFCTISAQMACPFRKVINN